MLHAHSSATMTMHAWSAVAAARAHDAAARVPFAVADGAASIAVGAVARAHLGALRRWPRWLQVHHAGVTLIAAPPARTEALTAINHALRADGLVTAWRDEPFALLACDGCDLGATMERAATRFWGTLTLGAHCNGYVAGTSGAPAQLWIARRSPTKATDPNRLDNLIGGGVPAGQSPLDTVVREGWEEAGLQPGQMHGLQRGRVLHLLRDIPEGLQREWIHVYDLALPAATMPRNQDGEVAALTLQGIEHALSLAAGDEMTVDAALVTLDFALRHRLLNAHQHEALEAACAGLFVGTAA